MIVRLCCSVIAVLLCLSIFLSTIDADGRVVVKGVVRLDKGLLPAGPSLADAGSGPAPSCPLPWFPGKPGVCPVNNLLGVCAVRQNKCLYDGNCPGDLKCCSRGCGRQCVAPYSGWLPAGPPSLADAGPGPTPTGAPAKELPWFPGKPGVCPVNNLLGVCAVRQNKCLYDGNCPGDLKCCSSGCGRQCVAPYSEKPGVCASASRRHCLRSENLCSQDGTCPDDLKCCNDGCGLRCLPPYKEKPGVCPSNPLRYCKRSENLCSQDGNCPGDLKCCSSGCGRQCVAPYSGWLPAVPPSLADAGPGPTPPGAPANGLPWLPGKPGVCPVNNLLGVCAVPQDNCFDDGNCPGDLKCCSSGCGRQCVAPYSEKPGVCASASRRYCLRSQNLCSQDGTCPDDLKCCNDGCGLRCLPPYKEKPGVCPSNPLRYCKRSENLCSQDGNCPGDLKCCTTGCGSLCVPPYKEKPGVCPINYFGVGVCAEMCSQDSDCPNNQKCCSNGCGRQCVAPYKVRHSPCAKGNGS